MSEYHKITTLFERDPDTKFRTVIEGQFATPEFEYLARNQWRLTEKIDGTNIRVVISPVDTSEPVPSQSLNFRGKTDNSQISTRLLEALRATFEPMASTIRDQFPDGATLYGEGYGAKIQKGGGNYRSDQGFILFDVRVGDWWLEHANVQDVAGRLGLDTVPVVGEGCTLHDMVDMVKGGLWSRWSDWGSRVTREQPDGFGFLAEGIVARPMVELSDRAGRRIITKLKDKDFPKEA